MGVCRDPHDWNPACKTARVRKHTHTYMDTHIWTHTRIQACTQACSHRHKTHTIHHFCRYHGERQGTPLEPTRALRAPTKPSQMPGNAYQEALVRCALKAAPQRLLHELEPPLHRSPSPPCNTDPDIALMPFGGTDATVGALTPCQLVGAASRGSAYHIITALDINAQPCSEDGSAKGGCNSTLIDSKMSLAQFERPTHRWDGTVVHLWQSSRAGANHFLRLH